MTQDQDFREAFPFCAERSAGVGEPLVGLGVHPQRNLLIRWPKAKWGNHPRIAADMSLSQALALRAAAAAGLRVGLIDRKEEPPGRMRVYLYPEGRQADLEPRQLTPFLLSVLRGTLDLSALPQAPQKLLLCCTHGKHDRCCARFGFPVYKALRAAAEGSDFEVWESSHLGGCRTAAVALTLPARHKYGRLTPEQIPAFLAAEAAGHPYWPAYRGNADLDRPGQAAEAEAVRVMGLERAPQRPELHELQRDPTRVTYRAQYGETQRIIVAEASRFGIYGSCEALHDDTRAPTETTIWRARCAAGNAPD
ncbi:MAG: sucrase ferredoxin [Rhodobacterales bacterium]|nr:MAG: sucrase ferredoxin [Rhodobacterales bacterium]